MSSKQDQTQVQAVFQKPIKFIENYWGQDVRADPRNRNYDVEMSFWPRFGRDRMNVGSLPYTTSPKMLRNPVDRMMSEPTKMGFSRACFNECVNRSGPWYLRHWQIWDYAPLPPTNGDVSKDPRYGMDTRQFTEPYLVSRNHSPTRVPAAP